LRPATWRNLESAALWVTVGNEDITEPSDLGKVTTVGAVRL